MNATRGRRGLSLAFAFVALGLAACGTADAPLHSSPTATATTTTPTTTTTLPPPVVVANSGVGGPFGVIGQVSRVAVPRVGRDHLAPPRSSGGAVASPTQPIGYRQFGSGPDLLLIAGEHSTMTSWDPRFLLDLAAHFTVTVFDFPDVGYSAPDSRYASVGALADYTAGLVWALGLERTTVLGWGFGGEVALSLVERHPGLVWRLVLADATPGGPTSAQPDQAVNAALGSPLETPTELSYLYYPSSDETARASWLADSAKVTADVMTAAAVAHDAVVVAAGYRSNVVDSDLGTVLVPTLIFEGALDDIVPASNAYLMNLAIPHTELVVFNGAGYASLFEDTPIVMKDLLGFLRS